MDDKKHYREVIMNNYKNPSNFSKKTPEGYIQASSRSKTCLDHFEIAMKLEDKKIKDIIFDGEGCSVSTASLNLIATYLKGKTLNEGIEFIDKYQAFIEKGEDEGIELNDLIVFKNIHVHLNRITCAMIGPSSIRKILEEQNA